MKIKAEQFEILKTAFLAAAVACEAAVNKYGEGAQELMLVEETGELLTAVARLHRGRGTSADIVAESADVFIMALQMGLLHGGGAEEFIAVLREKTERLFRRVGEPVSP